MYNSNKPSHDDLPTSAQLLRSTIIAFVTALMLLLTVVLPAEFGVDPTGIGRLLQLTEMGEIKAQLAAEAEEDRRRDREENAIRPSSDRRSDVLDRLRGALWVSTAFATERVELAQASRSDETVVSLKPTEGVEYKLTMMKGAKVDFEWRVQDGVVNYDMHGTPQGGGKEKSYKTGRAVNGDKGVLIAEFDGSHGWFWRNRGKAPVTITLRTHGAYGEIKRMN